MQAVFASGSYVSRTYTILSPRAGSSAPRSTRDASNLPAGFTAALSYTATDAILNLTAHPAVRAGLARSDSAA